MQQIQFNMEDLDESEVVDSKKYEGRGNKKEEVDGLENLFDSMNPSIKFIIIFFKKMSKW